MPPLSRILLTAPKCDGQLPCSTCRTTARSCLYSHDDRRRQRHTQNSEQSPFSHIGTDASTGGEQDKSKAGGDDDALLHTAPGEYVSVATQDVDRDGSFRSGGDSGGSGVRKLAVLHIKTPTAESDSRPRPQTTTRLSKATSRQGKDQGPEVRAIEEMQGKFEVRAGSMDPKSNAGTGAEAIL